ncbi:hypothetical protein [Streptomyces sp. A1136]|uniref:hypothetical protein n=1 Tax=Streptomyces sp. A1136 TaxID=2563102 RepID=UPI00109EB7AC|nr:hypothetical protein [Streptomyces sp. A1136]THA53233.1 hypothetical protein E6R62_19280 [Streptomyces sp. A1136]
MKTTRRAVAVLALAAPILAFAGVSHAAPADTPPVSFNQLPGSDLLGGLPVVGDIAKGGLPTDVVTGAVPGGLPGGLPGIG